MKKVLTIIAIMSFNLAMAQQSSVPYITMKSGKMVVSKQDGSFAAIGENVHIRNAGVVSMDGHYTTKEGKVVNVREGDKIYVDGNNLKIQELDQATNKGEGLDKVKSR